jgi:hypothetical protein
MDDKTRNLALLGGLSLFCGGVALISDHLVVAWSFLRSLQPPLWA